MAGAERVGGVVSTEVYAPYREGSCVMGMGSGSEMGGRYGGREFSMFAFEGRWPDAARHVYGCRPAKAVSRGVGCCEWYWRTHVYAVGPEGDWGLGDRGLDDRRLGD